MKKIQKNCMPFIYESSPKGYSWLFDLCKQQKRKFMWTHMFEKCDSNINSPTFKYNFKKIV